MTEPNQKYDVEYVIKECFKNYIDFTEVDLLTMEYLRENYSKVNFTWDIWYLTLIEAYQHVAEDLVSKKKGEKK